MPEYRIGRLNGRFTVSWIEDGRRRRYRLDALTAKAAESEAIDRIRRETIPAAGHTVASAWLAYLAERAGRPVAQTMASTGKAILAHFGALRPDQITTDHCRAYRKARVKAGKKLGTVWTELGHLRTALQWAVKARLIDHAPAIERPPKPAPKDRYLTHAEIARLLDAATEPHIRLAILLMLSTCARVTAALELTWARVDLDRGLIDLRLDATGPRKGRSVVPMNAGLRAALVTAREAALSDHVIEWAGEPVASIRTGFASTCARAGLQGVTLHTLRHSGAVHLVEAGISFEEVAQFMGHSNPGITFRVYGRYSPTHLRKAADVVDFAGLRIVS